MVGSSGAGGGTPCWIQGGTAAADAAADRPVGPPSRSTVDVMERDGSSVPCCRPEVAAALPAHAAAAAAAAAAATWLCCRCAVYCPCIAPAKLLLLLPAAPFPGAGAGPVHPEGAHQHAGAHCRQQALGAAAQPGGLLHRPRQPAGGRSQRAGRAWGGGSAAGSARAPGQVQQPALPSWGSYRGWQAAAGRGGGVVGQG